MITKINLLRKNTQMVTKTLIFHYKLKIIVLPTLFLTGTLQQVTATAIYCAYFIFNSMIIYWNLCVHIYTYLNVYVHIHIQITKFKGRTIWYRCEFLGNQSNDGQANKTIFKSKQLIKDLFFLAHTLANITGSIALMHSNWNTLLTQGFKGQARVWLLAQSPWAYSTQWSHLVWLPQAHLSDLHVLQFKPIGLHCFKLKDMFKLYLLNYTENYLRTQNIMFSFSTVHVNATEYRISNDLIFVKKCSAHNMHLIRMHCMIAMN